eukprot:9479477-Pyramimonas_sp.AAC.1
MIIIILYPDGDILSCVGSLHKPRRFPVRCGDAGTDEGKPESRMVASSGEVGSRRGEVGLVLYGHVADVVIESTRQGMVGSYA